jgi:hypothetical protein
MQQVDLDLDLAKSGIWHLASGIWHQASGMICRLALDCMHVLAD